MPTDQTQTKAPPDYAALLDEAELLRDGWRSRLADTTDELGKLLGDAPKREQIMQVIPRFALRQSKLAEAEENVRRYGRLLAKQQAENSNGKVAANV